LELRILGPLEAVVDAAQVPLGGAKQRALLAILAIRANAVVSVDELIDSLWGDSPPRTAEHSIQVYVSELRKALRDYESADATDRIARRGAGYVLTIEADQIDATRFERRVEQARAALAAGDAAGAAAVLHEALSMWRGAPLSDFAFDDFAQNEIARLNELCLSAIETRIEADLALGRHSALVPELQSLVAEHPLREGLREQLVLALYRAGRQADALQEIAAARAVLADELGLDPGPGLQRLETSILQHEPDIAPPEPTRLETPAEPTPSEPAASERPARERRKVVTVLFTDVSGSTALGDRLDPEALRDVMGRFFEASRAVLEQHGATVEKFIGDAVMAVFGIPRSHEDDALRAARAAIDMRDALDLLNVDLERDFGVTIQTRTGVNTGRVMAGDVSQGDRLITGDAVNVAARLEQSAEAGEILLGDDTYRLVRDAVDVKDVDPLDVRGKDQPISAYRLIGIREGTVGIRRHMDSPIVGRDQELAALGGALDRAIANNQCHLFTVIGEPGVGKSRLVYELALRTADRARALRGRCLAYGEGITFWPIVEVVKEAAGVDDADSPEEAREKVAATIGAAEGADEIVPAILQMVGLSGSELAQGETLWAARRFLEVLAAEQPLILWIEDVHWAEPTLLDLIEGVASWSQGVPILLICTARPEILEMRPTFAGGTLTSTSIALHPLTAADTAVMIQNLLGGAGVEQGLDARLAGGTDGNPLFVEQVVSMLVDDGILRERESGWSVVGDLSSLSVPAEIQALLSARLDRLPEVERRTLEVASVIGRQFELDMLESLLSDGDRSDVRETLGRLVGKDLIRPDRPGSRDVAFRFRHALILNTAYESMPKRARADLHERIADRMESTLGDRLAEYEEIVAHHLERAATYLRELGSAGDRSDALARRAGARLSTAGGRALARGDMPGAVSLYGSAARLLPAEDPDRTAFLADLGTALVEIGRWDQADVVFGEAIVRAEELDDLPSLSLALLYRFEGQQWYGQEEAAEASVKHAERLLLKAAERSDHVSRSRLLRIMVMRNWQSHARRHELTEEAMRAAELAGDRRAQREILQMGADDLVSGSVPVEEAIPISDTYMEIARGDRVAEAAVVVNARASLLAAAGRIDEAREEYERARATFRELGLRLWLAASGSIGPAYAEMTAGDLDRAESILRESVASLEAMSEGGRWLAEAKGMLAMVFCEKGQLDEAERLVERADDASPYLRDLTELVRAQILFERGDPGAAEPLLRRRLEFIDEDALTTRAYLHLDIGRALRALGRVDEATEAGTAALELFEQKGDVMGAARAREFLEG
jgi:class 3 adenylate cyclase/tetratricopeptide (TPR) repeat protein/DNA-binding winged helix-turn-helix (wHTH) protein